MRKHTWSIVALGVMSLLALGSMESQHPGSSGGHGERITRAEYGDDWPFSVASGRLYCDPPGSNVVLESSGKIYALNGRAIGSASQRGYIDARKSIMLKDGQGFFTVGDIQRIISRGLAMCR